jgi:methylmalonyl-CoA epimerase
LATPGFSFPVPSYIIPVPDDKKSLANQDRVIAFARTPWAKAWPRACGSGAENILVTHGGSFMKIKRIAHLGIAVKDLEAPKKLYADNFNLELKGEEVIETQKVKVSFIKVGESNLELLLPTSADSAVAKFLENKGEGFHHLALEVEDIHAAVEELKAAGVKLIDQTPREGAHGALVAFIHPKATFGLLVELCQYPQ